MHEALELALWIIIFLFLLLFVTILLLIGFQLEHIIIIESSFSCGTNKKWREEESGIDLCRSAGESAIFAKVGKQYNR